MGLANFVRSIIGHTTDYSNINGNVSSIINVRFRNSIPTSIITYIYVRTCDFPARINAGTTDLEPLPKWYVSAIANVGFSTRPLEFLSPAFGFGFLVIFNTAFIGPRNEGASLLFEIEIRNCDCFASVFVHKYVCTRGDGEILIAVQTSLSRESSPANNIAESAMPQCFSRANKVIEIVANESWCGVGDSLSLEIWNQFTDQNYNHCHMR